MSSVHAHPPPRQLGRFEADAPSKDEPKRPAPDQVVKSAHDPHGPKRLWVSLAVVLTVCALIAAIVASR